MGREPFVVPIAAPVKTANSATSSPADVRTLYTNRRTGASVRDTQRTQVFPGTLSLPGAAFLFASAVAADTGGGGNFREVGFIQLNTKLQRRLHLRGARGRRDGGSVLRREQSAPSTQSVIPSRTKLPGIN